MCPVNSVRKTLLFGECVQGTPTPTHHRGSSGLLQPLPLVTPTSATLAFFLFLTSIPCHTHTQDCNLFAFALCRMSSFSFFCAQLKFHFHREASVTFSSVPSFQLALFSSYYLSGSKITLLSDSLIRLRAAQGRDFMYSARGYAPRN